MASRVGHIKEIFADGTCRAVNEIEGLEFFGRLVIRSGGGISFDILDERNQTVGAEAIHPEMHPDGDSMQHPEAEQMRERPAIKRQKVTVKR